MNTNYRVLTAERNPWEFWEAVESIKKEKVYSSSCWDKSELEYYKQRWNDDGINFKDISKIIIGGDKAIGGFLVTEHIEGSNRKLGYCESSMQLIERYNLSKKEKRMLVKLLKREIDQKNTEYCIQEGLNSDGLTTCADYLLCKSDSIVDIDFTRLIDLENEISYIKSRLRKSYKQLVNKKVEGMRIKISERETCNWKEIDEFRLLHIVAAGRETRSINTWKKQYDAVKGGKAFTVYVYIGNEMRSAGYFSNAYNHCYYGVSATHPRNKYDSLSHVILWEAIKYAKSKGSKVFETGRDYVINDTHSKNDNGGALEQKQLSIAHFKAGFGGTLHSILNIKGRSLELQCGNESNDVY